LLIVASLIHTAQLTWIPVSESEYEQCLKSAKATQNKHPQCYFYETIWERSFADPIAYYTMWLTFFTAALAILGIGGIALTSQQISLARDDFNAANRPEIAIQSIVLREHFVNERLCLAASVTCFNRGRVEATKFQVFGDILRTAQPAPDVLRDEIKTRSSVVRRGMAHQFDIKSDYPMDDESFRDAFSDKDHGPRVYCVGVIHYSNPGGDPIGKTGFCRVWRDNAWQPTNNPELEFEL
jgi:hypothetical protein